MSHLHEAQLNPLRFLLPSIDPAIFESLTAHVLPPADESPIIPVDPPDPRYHIRDHTTIAPPTRYSFPGLCQVQEPANYQDVVIP